jgi:hypothetical protein
MTLEADLPNLAHQIPHGVQRDATLDEVTAQVAPVKSCDFRAR